MAPAPPTIAPRPSLEAPSPLVRSATVPIFSPVLADPSHLAPDAAFHASPPRRLHAYDHPSHGSEHRSLRRPRLRDNNSSDGRSSRRRGRKSWKKLLWVKQSYPDNYTDQATFLENLQRNPQLQPYDFWPLVADSTVIVQHVCSVIIFVVCFVGIFQERVSPMSVVGWGSCATLIGWLLWDWWIGKESNGEEAEGLARSRSLGGRQFREHRARETVRREDSNGLASNSSLSNLPSAASSSSNLLNTQQSDLAPRQPVPANSSSNIGLHSHSPSVTSLLSTTSQTSNARFHQHQLSGDAASPAQQRHRPSSPLRGGRGALRANTIKSAVLIYFTVLGLSPILKSLTRSTSSDSIWAMSFWLLAINIFFFDYSGTWVGVNAFPVASLSTNAAVMASTVLASRLPSTGQVFSLSLFSIEVFGLFPVFRRYARHRSWTYHVVLTVLLVLGAGAGVAMVLAGPGGGGGEEGGGGRWPWRSGLLGMLVGCVMAAVAMGGCSWWLIGLQKYKNEIYGPWDPARPIIMSRRHWDGD